MKIAIASDDERTISSHFGRAKGFVIYEVKEGEIINKEYRLNTFTPHVRGGDPHDRHGPILRALKDCKVVISHGMGRRIYEDLKKTGIEVFITEETRVEEALRRYLKRELVHREELECNH